MRGGGNMMKQAMALQANMKKAQDEIAAMEIVGESGGGMVKVTMNGKHEVKRVQIEPQVASEDREMLEDLIAAAFNDAVNKADAASQARMSSVMSGIRNSGSLACRMMPFAARVRYTGTAWQPRGLQERCDGAGADRRLLCPRSRAPAGGRGARPAARAGAPGDGP